MNPSAPHHAEPPHIEGLTIRRLVGEGGFARVWLATDPTLGREVAVKVLNARLTDEATAQRFRRECMALGAVSGHPNIVTVHAVGTTEAGLAHLVMGFESGGSLGDRLDEGPLPWAEVLDIGIRMADALEVAHRAGVLHRDVKPDNILIGAYGDPKLTDFGIARLTGGPHTTSGRVTASIAHAPPEILGGTSPDVGADVYSLCSTMFTLVAGSTPFERDTDESLLPLIARIVSEPPPPLPGGTPETFSAVLRRGLSKSADNRQPTAADLAAELRAVAHDAGLPVPPSRTGGVAAGTPAGLSAAAGPGLPRPEVLQPTPQAARPATAPPPATAPGPPPPTAPGPRPLRDPGAGPARSSLVLAAGIALAAVLIGGGVWALLSGGETADPPQATAPTAGVAVPTPGIRPAGQLTEGPEGGTDAVDPPVVQTPSDASDEDAPDPDPITDLATALLTPADLPDTATPLDQVRTADPSDSDHPLLDYGYCSIAVDLAGIGAGVADVFSLGATTDVGISAIIATDSPETAAGVIDQIRANAMACQTFPTPTGASIELLGVEDVDGLLRLDLDIVVLAQRFPSTTVFGTAGALVVSVEVPGVVDPEEAIALAEVVIERAAELEAAGS